MATRPPRARPREARAGRELNPTVGILIVVIVLIAIGYFFVRSGHNEITLPSDPKAYDALAPSDEMIERMKQANPNLKLPPEMAAAVERRRERERQGIHTPSMHEAPAAAAPPGGPPPTGDAR
ncbi:MAG: hypothetical protein IT208_02270 [Chthonomonadales bacterium]|nr:hypothetical protein [Chthonomonadales bacterium]